MLAKAIYLGYYPLGGDLEIDGIKIMQLNGSACCVQLSCLLGKQYKG